MRGGATVNTGVLGIADEDFWGDLSAARAEALQRLSHSEWRGYALDAPRVVDMGVRDTLPVALLRCVSAVDSAAHDLQRNALLVAVRRDTSELFIAHAFEQKYTPSPRKLRTPSPFVTVTDGFIFEARERLRDLPWSPGSYALYLLVLDVATEAVVVRLAVPSGPSLHLSPPLEAPWPPLSDGPLPRYSWAEGSPAVPAGPGVSLVCPRVTLVEPGARCVLEGAFHLQADITDDVEAHFEDEPTTRTAAINPVEFQREEPCLARVTLVLTGSSLDEPWSCALAVPAVRSGGAFRGHLALDLFTLPGFPQGPGSYSLWAFAGDVIAGPEPLALILEDRLAPA